jgi:hypothetical protein
LTSSPQQTTPGTFNGKFPSNWEIYILTLRIVFLRKLHLLAMFLAYIATFSCQSILSMAFPTYSVSIHSLWDNVALSLSASWMKGVSTICHSIMVRGSRPISISTEISLLLEFWNRPEHAISVRSIDSMGLCGPFVGAVSVCPLVPGGQSSFHHFGKQKTTYVLWYTWSSTCFAKSGTHPLSAGPEVSIEPERLSNFAPAALQHH